MSICQHMSRLHTSWPTLWSVAFPAKEKSKWSTGLQVTGGTKIIKPWLKNHYNPPGFKKWQQKKWWWSQAEIPTWNSNNSKNVFQVYIPNMSWHLPSWPFARRKVVVSLLAQLLNTCLGWERVCSSVCWFVRKMMCILRNLAYQHRNRIIWFGCAPSQA